MTEQDIRKDEREKLAQAISDRFGLLAPYKFVVDFIRGRT